MSFSTDNININRLAREFLDPVFVEYFQGIDSSNLMYSLILSDLTAVALPSILLMKRSKCENFLDLKEYTEIMKFAGRRAKRVRAFIDYVSDFVLPGFISNFGPITEQISRLAEDTHNGGASPLLISSHDQKFVVKFNGLPQYKLWNAVLRLVEIPLGLNLSRPILDESQTAGWYVTPFYRQLTPDLNDVNHYMYAFGVTIAVGSALRITDAHLENVVIDGYTPLLIDAECMPYPGSNSPKERLLHTGLISATPGTSALTGGAGKSRRYHSYLSKTGMLSYVDVSRGLTNRLRTSSGDFADPTKYITEITKGFSDAFDIILLRKAAINKILRESLTNDYSIRVIFRATRHYTSVIEMQKIPAHGVSSTWVFDIFDKFSKSSSYCGTVSEDILNAEVSDLADGDIPYFCYDMSTKTMIHNSHQISEWHYNGNNFSLDGLLCDFIESEKDTYLEVLRSSIVM